MKRYLPALFAALLISGATAVATTLQGSTMPGVGGPALTLSGCSNAAPGNLACVTDTETGFYLDAGTATASLTSPSAGSVQETLSSVNSAGSQLHLLTTSGLGGEVCFDFGEPDGGVTSCGIAPHLVGSGTTLELLLASPGELLLNGGPELIAAANSLNLSSDATLGDSTTILDYAHVQSPLMETFLPDAGIAWSESTGNAFTFGTETAGVYQTQDGGGSLTQNANGSLLTVNTSTIAPLVSTVYPNVWTGDTNAGRLLKACTDTACDGPGILMFVKAGTSTDNNISSYSNEGTATVGHLAITSTDTIFSGTISTATGNCVMVDSSSGAITCGGLIKANGFPVPDMPQFSAAQLVQVGNGTIGTSATYTFTTATPAGVAFSSTPVCTCTDTTANASIKCVASTTAVTPTGTGTDTFSWICVGPK